MDIEQEVRKQRIVVSEIKTDMANPKLMRDRIKVCKSNIAARQNELVSLIHRMENIEMIFNRENRRLGQLIAARNNSKLAEYLKLQQELKALGDLDLGVLDCTSLGSMPFDMPCDI